MGSIHFIFWIYDISISVDRNVIEFNSNIRDSMNCLQVISVHMTKLDELDYNLFSSCIV